MKKKHKLNLNKFLVTVFTFFAFLFSNTTKSLEKLKISSIPDESITELHKKFLPLKDYLEEQLNLEIEFVPVSDHASVVEALSTNKIDLAWLGGFTFIQAFHRSNGKVEPIIQRQKDERFSSVFIVSKNDNFSNINDLKDQPFSFGSPSSTSGHIMPRYFLMKKNINPELFFNPIAFSGAHDATLYSVLSGKVKGGVLNSVVWKKLINEKPKLSESLEVLYETQSYYDYNWTIRTEIPDSIKNKIINAFLSLDKNNSKHQKILKLQRAEKYIRTEKKNYDNILDAAKSAKIIN